MGWPIGGLCCINNANWLAAHGLLAVVRAFDAVPGGSVAIPDPSTWRWGHAPLAEITCSTSDARGQRTFRAGHGADWLIDAGRPGTYVRERAAGVAGAFGVTRFGARGGLILSRADADHSSAAPLALADLQPRRVVDSRLAANTLPLARFPAFPRSERGRVKRAWVGAA